MKWKNVWIFVWLLTLLAVFVVTLVNHSPYFLLGGSSSVAPLLEELLNNYPERHSKNGDFNYVSSASSGAMPRVKNGTFGIGWLSKSYESDDESLFTFKLLTDGLIIIYNLPKEVFFNPNVPLDFNSQKIQQLYLENKSWKEVFPKEIKTDMPVKTFTRPNGSGTRDVFDSKALGGQTYYKSNTVDSSNAMLNLDVGSIGYSSFADFNQTNLSDFKKMTVKAATWNSVIPTFENIKDGSYQLSRPFTGLINRNYKYRTEIADFLYWIFGNNINVLKIFKKYGPRVDISENQTLDRWVDKYRTK